MTDKNLNHLHLTDKNKAVREFFASLIINLSLLIAGGYLLSQAFGWQAGVGLAMLFTYIKGAK